MLHNTAPVPHAAFPMVMTSAKPNERMSEKGFFRGGFAGASVELAWSKVVVLTQCGVAGSIPVDRDVVEGHDEVSFLFSAGER